MRADLARLQGEKAEAEARVERERSEKNKALLEKEQFRAHVHHLARVGRLRSQHRCCCGASLAQMVSARKRIARVRRSWPPARGASSTPEDGGVDVIGKESGFRVHRVEELGLVAPRVRADRGPVAGPADHPALIRSCRLLSWSPPKRLGLRSPNSAIRNHP